MIKYWVWLASVCNADLRAKIGMLERYGTPKEIFFASENEILEIDWLTEKGKREFQKKNLSKAYGILEECQEKDIDIITVQDARYPERLRNIDDFPLVIYVKGRMPAVDEEAAIAIVGTRKATPYGIRSAEKVGYELARSGGLVVSGLAAGIDSAGALGAIKAGKGVIGVLGCNIDEVYPRSAEGLYNDVRQVGALVSEYPPGYPIKRENFPARNRIISGLSVGVVIIEAPARSGALITANLALEQGRELFVVPGNVDSAASMGSNRLLSESSAKAVMSARDILMEFEGLFSWKMVPDREPDDKFLDQSTESEAGEAQKSKEKQGHTGSKESAENAAMYPENEGATSEKLKKVIDNSKDKSYIDLQEQLEALSGDELTVVSGMTGEPKHIDDIIDDCGLPANKVLAAMTMLQIKGHVAEHKGKRFSLIIIKK